MFENLGHFFKKIVKEPQKELGSKDAAKERLHLVLMQDRANVSADFLELMKQEIIDVIKKYIVVDEDSIDVRLTNQTKEDGTNGAPSLYANIPIVNIKNDMMAEKIKDFEGVDFNKEMGIPTYSESLNEEEKAEVSLENKEEIPSVIELPENNNETEILPENNKEKNTKEIEEQEVAEEVFEEVDDADDDDDDVTFDDLLKAAEAAEKMAEEQLEKKESKQRQAENDAEETDTEKEETDTEKEETNKEKDEINKDNAKEETKKRSSKKSTTDKRKKK